jgi:hypothetical protein
VAPIFFFCTQVPNPLFTVPTTFSFQTSTFHHIIPLLASPIHNYVYSSLGYYA